MERQSQFTFWKNSKRKNVLDTRANLESACIQSGYAKHQVVTKWIKTSISLLVCLRLYVQVNIFSVILGQVSGFNQY